MLTSLLGRKSRPSGSTTRRGVAALVVTIAGTVTAGMLVAPATAVAIPATVPAAAVAGSATGVATAGALQSVRTADAEAGCKNCYRPKEGAAFNVARGGSAQYIIERKIIGAIDKARPKSTIKMSMFSFDRMPVADALVRAKKRNVKVRVLVNNHEMTAAQSKLRSVLGSNRKKGSWWGQCVSSCRGQGDVNHSKFITFSQTGAARYVTMVGSMNMKQNGTDNQFNDLFTENGQKALFELFSTTFNQMSRDRNANPMYVRKNIGGRFQVHILPFPKAPLGTSKTRYTAYKDPINQILRPIKCTGANVPSGRTAIRVNMHAWDGDRGAMLANRFRDLYAQGCDVKLMVGFAGARVRQIFANRTKRGYVPVRSTGFDTNGDRQIDLYSHEKTLMVNGHYGNEKGRRFIVTGSANHQDGGQYGDEIIMRVNGAGLHQQYVNNWNYKWNNKTHGFGWQSEGARARTAGPPILDWNGLGTDSPEWQDE